MILRLTAKSTGLLSRYLSTTSQLNVKVTVLGAAGDIGQHLSLLLKQCPLIKQLALYDIANTPGVTADIAHINTPTRVTGFHGKECLHEALHESDIIILSDGMGRESGMTRDDLFDSNANIVFEMGTAIANVCPKAIVGVVTNPINSLIPVLGEVMMKEKQFDPRRIIGVTTVDEVRTATFVGIANNIDPSSINIPVIGGSHSGTTIVPLLSQCRPLTLIPDKLARRIVEDVREAGTRIIETKAGTGSGTISAAWATAQFTIKLVKAFTGETNIFGCAYVVSDLCATTYFALPIGLGRSGVERDFGLPVMNDLEIELLHKAIPKLKKDVQRGIHFVQRKKD